MNHFFGVTLQLALAWLLQFVSYMNYCRCLFFSRTVQGQRYWHGLLLKITEKKLNHPSLTWMPVSWRLLNIRLKSRNTKVIFTAFYVRLKATYVTVRNKTGAIRQTVYTEVLIQTEVNQFVASMGCTLSVSVSVTCLVISSNQDLLPACRRRRWCMCSWASCVFTLKFN